MPPDVQWEAIAQKDQGASYLQDDYFTNVSFVPLANALKQTTTDAMGADALKAKLKKVVITYDKATAPTTDYSKGVKFEDGTLTIDFPPFTQPAGSGDTYRSDRGGPGSKAPSGLRGRRSAAVC